MDIRFGPDPVEQWQLADEAGRRLAEMVRELAEIDEAEHAAENADGAGI